MDVIALVVSVLALVLSLIQFMKDESRQKKESTLIAYNELQNDVFSQLTKLPDPLPPVEYLSDKWTELTIYLAKLERFSVGINTGIYSIGILDRLGGAYYIRQFEKLKPIIDRKRKEKIVPGKHYDEFELTVKKLKKRRKLHSGAKTNFYSVE